MKAYLIEYLLLLVYSFVAFCFFALLTGVFLLKFYRQHHHVLFHILKVVLVIILLINSLGFAGWVVGVENKYIQEADPFVTSLPYIPLEWQPVFAGTEIYLYQPIYPLQNLGEVATVWFGWAILQITLAFALSLLYLHWRRQMRDAVLSITVLFLWQYFCLSLLAILFLFKVQVVIL